MKPLVLILLIVPLTSQESTSCSTEKFRVGRYERYYGLCCGDTKYYLPTTMELQPSHKCNVPPQDPSLSYEDSVWTAFACLVKETLGSSVTLSKQSFFGFMSKNMEEARRARILETVENVIRGEPSLSKDEMSTLKSWWNEYFKVEFEACGIMEMYKSHGESDKKNLTKAELISTLEPAETCTRGVIEKIPRVMHHEAIFNMNWMDVNKSEECEKQVSKYKMESYDSPLRFMSYICHILARVQLTLEDVSRGRVDYNSIMNAVLPKYYSTSARKRALGLTFDRLKKRQSLKADFPSDLNRIVPLIQENYKRQLTNVTFSSGEPFSNMEHVLNAKSIHEVYYSAEISSYGMCQSELLSWF